MEIKVLPRFITKETAKLLYDKGITKAEEYYYDTENNGIYPKLTQDIVRKWLREKCEIDICIQYTSDRHYEGKLKTPFMGKSLVLIKGAITYEMALETCLEKGLLIL